MIYNPKICLVITNSPPLVGGLEKVCLRLAQNLQKLGYEVTILGRFTQRRHQLQDFFSISEKVQDLEWEGVRVKVLGLDGKAMLLLKPVFKLIWRKSTFSLARWLYVTAMRGQIAEACRGADVVHFFGNGPEMLGFAAEAAARLVGAKFVVEPALHEGQWGDKWFVRGLRCYAGYRQTGMDYARDARASGVPKYTFWKLLELAADGIFTFSSKPLRLATMLGFCSVLVALAYSAYIVLWRLISDEQLPGFASIIVVVLYLGSVQLFCMGILGEYIGRIHDEVKRRPGFIVSRIVGQNVDKQLP